MMRAISAAGRLNVPGGGYVETVFTFRTHRFVSAMALEILDRALMFPSGGQGAEGAEIPPLPGQGIALTRIQAVFTGFEMTNHRL